MASAHVTEHPFQVATVDVEVFIAAPRERVWSTFIEQTTRWWLKEYYSVSQYKGFVIEPRLGGRAYEDWGDGRGAEWYSIALFDPPKAITFRGIHSARYGGPATAWLEIVFEDTNSGTLVKLKDCYFGRFSEANVTNISEGWRVLLTNGLKAFIETGATAALSLQERRDTGCKD